MNRRALLTVLILLSACASNARQSLTPPPAYPWSGFGRIGCYAGPGLRRGDASEADTAEAVAGRGPWLVLDSVSVAELYAAGYRAAQIERGALHPGTLLERRDTVEWTGGTWWRVGLDSVVFNEESTFPPVVWRLRQFGDELRGEGVLVHDVVLRDLNGNPTIPVSRWPVRLRRISCAAVPVKPR